MKKMLYLFLPIFLGLGTPSVHSMMDPDRRPVKIAVAAETFTLEPFTGTPEDLKNMFIDLGKCPDLKSLTVMTTSCPEEFLAPLIDLPNLKVLTIRLEEFNGQTLRKFNMKNKLDLLDITTSKVKVDFGAEGAELPVNNLCLRLNSCPEGSITGLRLIDKPDPSTSSALVSPTGLTVSSEPCQVVALFTIFGHGTLDLTNCIIRSDRETKFLVNSVDEGSLIVNVKDSTFTHLS